MNLHMPQDIEAESELRNLAAVPYQIISPANNSSIIGIYQDSMLGCYRFTREQIDFTQKDAMNLLMMFNRINPDTLKKKKNERISNFEILSQIMPPLSLKVKNKQFDNDKDKMDSSNNVVEIINGKYLRGQMDKGILGAGTKGLIHRVCNDFGNMASAQFIDDLQNIVTEYMKQSAFSVGISDLITDKKTNEKIISILTEKKTEVKNLFDQVKIGVFENNSGKTNEEEVESKVNNILSKAQNDAGGVSLRNLDKENRFLIMFYAGSKGTEINIQQMTSCLGQQNVDGKRIPYGFEHRTLPHYTKYDDSAIARGFVESSYINGLSPQELFFHAMGGRIGLIDTAVKTSTTGYIQRRLIKALEDLKVEYDMTIRTNKGKIVQFAYGDDSVDTIKVENQDLPIVEMSIQDIYAHFTSATLIPSMFVKSVYNKQKKQANDINAKCEKYVNFMVESRNKIIKNVFGNKSEKVVRVPVAFAYIIQNVIGQQGINKNSLVDITMLEAFDAIEKTFAKLELITMAPPTELFKVLYFYYLSPKDLLINKRFNKKALDILLETITLTYKRAIVNPGEMVGMIAAQSIGEPTTQMSITFCEHIRCVKINKITKNISSVTEKMGDFCDKIIEENPQLTFNTGHVNSVETLLDGLEDEYYIMGVDDQEQTHWNKISHVSRHPTNGNLVKVTTKSGRMVTTTLSHSHLIRDETTQKVKPILGSELKEKMRIPVSKFIPNTFVKETIEIGSNVEKLDYLFGWFIGAYLAEGSINGNTICITNMAENYINNVMTIATRFGKTAINRKYQGEYGISVSTSFSHKELAPFIIRTCATGSFVKRVPDFAFTAPQEFKSGLLQGYMDGDGNFQSDEKHHQIRACSRSKQLAEDLALFFNYFGIFASIKTQMVKGAEMYCLTISAKYAKLYQDNIGSVVHADKLLNLVSYLNRENVHNLSDDIDKINGLGEIIARCGKVLKLEGQSRTYGRWIKKDSIGRRTLQKYVETFESHENKNAIADELKILRQALDSNVIWDEIVNIEIMSEHCEEYVYDFTVPANQTFMLNSGIIVHNTLNSVTYETPIMVRNRDGIIQKYEIGDFIESKIKVATKTEYYKEKDTTYSEVDDYYEIQSCDENGNILWKRIEAVTRHPVINTDGTNTMLKITTDEEREVIATKAKSFLKLVDGKIIPVNGDSLKEGDYLPVSIAPIDFTENNVLNLKEILPPTQYILQTNKNDYNIPEKIELNYNFGYLVGAYAAEGCMTKHQISIANNVDNYFEPILELMKEWNITTKVYIHKDKIQVGWTSQDLRIYNTVLCRILDNLCGKLSHNKFVSDKIVFSNKECILGFLDAYIGGDGYVDIRHKCLVMSSVSKQMLVDVQNMLKVLNVNSFVFKSKKQERNNRGTLPENIHQLYNLKIVGSQLKNLIPLLNIRLDYKQNNLNKLLEYNYKYYINQKVEVIPNEIDGNLVLQQRDHNYMGVMFDKIKSIEEVSNTTNYAYDLTIEGTRTFNIYNGLALFDTFHFAGIASKSNVTRGVPRIEEILSISASIKNPSLTIYLKPEDETDKNKANTFQYMIEYTKLSEIVISEDICFDPDDLNTLINEDKLTMSQFREFENMIDECMEQDVSEDINEKSKWIIRLVLDPEAMLEKNITMDDVNFTLNNVYKDEISCVYSDYNADKLVFRIRMNSVLKNASGKNSKKNKINPLDQSDEIYILKNFKEELLNKIVLRGVENINKVILRTITNNLVERGGAYKKEDIWVLDTIGTNLIDVLGLDYIDYKRTISNDITEIYDVLGMEAARQCIYNELADVLEFDGAYVNSHHMGLLCDRMTFSNKLISIYRHGINNDDIGPIAKASFEETPEMFLKAARHAELDTLRGISANVMCGQEGMFGTGAFQVLLDINNMINLDEKYKYEYQDKNELINDGLFNGLEDPNDKCSKQNIEIQTNVGNVMVEDMGDDNDYDPFA